MQPSNSLKKIMPQLKILMEEEEEGGIEDTKFHGVVLSYRQRYGDMKYMIMAKCNFFIFPSLSLCKYLHK